MKKVFFSIAGALLFAPIALWAQDTTKRPEANWSYHFQLTVIAQRHSAFKALYSGEKSLADTVEPTAISLTSTLFLGRRLWKGAAFYFNPEVAGGKGLSFSTGVAGALNGETYRVGQVEPQVFVARAYLQQQISLSKTSDEYLEDDLNQIAGHVSGSRIVISAGRFAMADFFDDNQYSKDPRTQFFNWSLWANGAWDYPANTRGYTYGIVAELIKPKWSLRVSSVAVPRIANSPSMEYRLGKAHSETIEFEHKISINKRPGNIRFMASSTYTQAPSYKDGIKAIQQGDTFIQNVISGEVEHNAYGGRKFALGFNIDQELSDEVGAFGRIGWNDGKYATWAFTEIDQTLSAGVNIKGTWWKRPEDVIGIAGVINGISKDHQDYLKAGGSGFIVGDGKLNYGHEAIMEAFYNLKLTRFLWATVDYQFVNNPGYNKDRGPVHAFAVRGHIQI